MRLKDFASFFRREDFDAMTTAYNEAWQQLRWGGSKLTDSQARILERKLTQIILASACNGIRDVVRLREIALRGISWRAFHRLTMLVPHFLPAILLPT